MYVPVTSHVQTQLDVVYNDLGRVYIVEGVFEVFGDATVLEFGVFQYQKEKLSNGSYTIPDNPSRWNLARTLG